MKPNLFDYATSELSQDAFICWLLSWGSPEFKEVDGSLHQCALTMFNAFFQKHKQELPSINSINIYKQFEHIDVLCVINESFAIIIEDKTGTKNHDDQLVRYKQKIENLKTDDGSQKFDSENILLVYYKTEDQSNFTTIENASYHPFLREDILKVLHSYDGDNAILLDYRQRLQNIEELVQSYLSIRIDKWGWYQWIGFYQNLQKCCDGSSWYYVPNKSSGFLCFLWFGRSFGIYDLYLQLEEHKLCFKIAVSDEKYRKELRIKWHKKIVSLDKTQNIIKPKRFGLGKDMTLCVWENYRAVNNNGSIDIGRTAENLQAAKQLLLSAIDIE